MPAKKTAKKTSARKVSKPAVVAAAPAVAAKVTAKVTPKAAAPVAAKGKAPAFKQLCAKIGIDPKTARRVLRKRMRSDVPQIGKVHAIGNRWVLDANGTKLVETTLRSYLETREAA
jgi:hypothetical protein